MNFKYSNELTKLLEFMNTTLINELPTTSLTIEHMLLAILQNRTCKAYIILDESLSSFTLEGIHDIVYEILKQSSLLAIRPSQKIVFDEKLNEIMTKSNIECSQMGENILTTEHVLLAILSDENKIKEAFVASGLDYIMFLNKIKSSKESLENITNNGGSKSFETVTAGATFRHKKPKTNMIDTYCVNLNKLADENKIDVIVGRGKEINQIIKTLNRRKKNNTILVGEGGVGKTGIPGQIARLIQEGNVPSTLLRKKIVSLDITAMLAGTQLRGMFEERIKGLVDELKNNDDYILFIDNIENVMGNSSKTGDVDISAVMSSALDSGEIQVIGTTTFKDYKNSFETNSSLARKFQKIIIEPTSIDETVEILENIKHYYEDFHNVQYSKETIKACVELSNKYITERNLPDKAIDLLDLCGSHVALNNEPKEFGKLRKKIVKTKKDKLLAITEDNYEKIDQLTAEENKIKLELIEKEKEFKKQNKNNRIIVDVSVVYDLVSEKSGVPVSKLNSDEKKKLGNINNILKQSVIGQDDAVDKVCQVIKRNRIGLGNANRPMSVQLFLGASGCGKTLLAKQLAKEIFGDEKYLVRFDMSEYSDKTSVNKLIGASAGYVGFEQGGLLVEAIRNKKHCVLVFDEIEKADNQVHNIFLQLFDEGHLTDNTGQKVDFKNVIIIMTSNVGVRSANEMGSGIGFTKNAIDNKKHILEKELKKTFPPEFINRLDDIVYFNTLTDDNFKKIIELEIDKLRQKLEKIGHTAEYDEPVVDFILKLITEKRNEGARPVVRLIQNKIEDPITDLLVENDYENYKFIIKVIDDKLVIK